VSPLLCIAEQNRVILKVFLGHAASAPRRCFVYCPAEIAADLGIVAGRDRDAELLCFIAWCDRNISDVNHMGPFSA